MLARGQAFTPCACEQKHSLFAQALALQSSSRNCSPAPHLVLDRAGGRAAVSLPRRHHTCYSPKSTTSAPAELGGKITNVSRNCRHGSCTCTEVARLAPSGRKDEKPCRSARRGPSTSRRASSASSYSR